LCLENFVLVNDSILITGANGFIGRRVVENLLARGFSNLRCLVRSSSKLEELQNILKKFPDAKKVELIYGDVISQEDCRRATQNVSIIFHLAAGFEKSFAGAFMNSALGTRNLIEAFLEGGQPKRFVSVSSFAVYSNLKMERGAWLDENSPLEDASQDRYDAYGFGKLKQEEIVRAYGKNRELPYVILRPGAVFGPGKTELSGRVGINTFGFFIHLGGANELPLTFVDNCADAIVLAGLTPGVDGETFNVVDDEKMTSREFLAARKRAKKFFSISIPYPLTAWGSRLWENYSKKSKGQLPPVFNRRRCAAEWKGNRYSNEKIKTRLNWKPKVKMADAMDLFLAQYK
jgi:nucleoside-diphosphate-sugar epimerase